MSKKARTRTKQPHGAGHRNQKMPQNTQRSYERYLELARDEARRGDTIAAENYLQHAEHYLRSMQKKHVAGSPD
jgi:hypothetical protein